MALNIGLLGYKFKNHGRRRIAEEIRKLNHNCVKLDLNKLCLSVDKKLSGFQNKIKLHDLDIVLPRFSTQKFNFGLMAMRQFKGMGVPTVNSYRSIRLCQNKYLTSLALKKVNIPQPRSFVASSAKSVLGIVNKLENPIIFKLLNGGAGTGVALINTATEAQDWLTTLDKLHKLLYLQEYIPHERKEDYRLFVLGDEVIGAMRRIAVHGWKTNFSLRGNKVSPMKPNKELRKLAIKAAKAVHADICGVDIMAGHKGNQVIEVNQHPGFRGLEKATGKNIARKIVKFTIARARKHRRLKKKRSLHKKKSNKIKKKTFIHKIKNHNLLHKIKKRIKKVKN